jgi:hypothetical protein
VSWLLILPHRLQARPVFQSLEVEGQIGNLQLFEGSISNKAIKQQRFSLAKNAEFFRCRVVESFLLGFLLDRSPPILAILDAPS